MTEDEQPYKLISPKILFYIKNKTKITFRLEKMPEYFYTGIITSIVEDHKKDEYRQLVLKLDNGEEMLFHEDDILESSIHPASIQPIKSFERITITEETRMNIFEKANYKCELKLEGCTKKATEIDHIIPVSKGGSNETYNLQASCLKCNRMKSNKL